MCLEEFLLSDIDTKKPDNRENLIEIVRHAARKDAKVKTIKRGKSSKPTISGTAQNLGIHRDTLYTWLREFNVDFKEILTDINISFDKEIVGRIESTYLIGEALLGGGNEIAHVDLLIGDKDGPVGKAFANGFSNLSAGHTPLLAVIRPNLPPKPHTLLVPKVTVKNMKDAGKIFGPAQAAVAKAVADSVEEGIIPNDKVDEWVIYVLCLFTLRQLIIIEYSKITIAQPN